MVHHCLYLGRTLLERDAGLLMTNRKKLWTTIIVLIMLVGLPLGSWFFLFQGKKLWKDRYIPEFELTSLTKSAFTEDDLLGKVHVAHFTFLGCEQPYCDDVWKAMQSVQRTFSEEEDLLLVTYSIDPEADSMPVLEAKAEKYGVIPGKWFFVTGSKSDLADVVVEGYRITKLRFREEGYTKEDLKASPRLALVQPDGYIKGYYPVEDEEDVDRLIKDILEMLKESE